jgi:uncharacterized protein
MKFIIADSGSTNWVNEARDDKAKTQSFLERLAQILVVDASSVRVEAEITGTETALRLHAAPADVSRLIGKQGRVAHSLRVVLGAIGVTQGVHYKLEIVEERTPRVTPAIPIRCATPPNSINCTLSGASYS